MSIRDLLRTLRRNVIILLACLAGGAGAGAFLAFSAPTTYTTQTRLFVSSNGSDSTDSLLQNSNLVLDRVPSYVTLVNSPLVVNRVVERLRLTESPDSVARRIEATNPLQTALIEITVQDRTARGAYDLAMSIAEVVTSVVQGIETSSTGFAPVKVTVVSQPEVPARPDLDAPAWRLGVGLLLGLVLGTVLAVARELFDTRLKDPEDLRTKLGLPPLAVITTGEKPDRMPPAVDDAYWTSPGSEGFRQLRTNLQVLVAAGNLRSVLVTGPHPADGAPTVAQYLALALGLAKVRVLLVEANLRQPRLAETFGIAAYPDDDAAGPGLSAVLAGDADIDAAIHRWRDGTLHLLPAGPLSVGSSELLASDAMGDLLGRLERRFDLVIVDAPPLLEAADAAVLATRVDGVVLAVRNRGTTWDAVWRAVQALHDVQARVLGAAVLSRTGVMAAAPRDALRVPVAASRWSAARGPVPAPRAPAAGDDTGPHPRRPLRPVPDLPKPVVLPGVAQPGAPLAGPARPARGVAAVGDNNRVVPHDSADAGRDGTDA